MTTHSTTPAGIDLTNCDQEPIHIPGSVQTHAVMLVLEEPGLLVRQASANVPAMLGLPITSVLDRPLSALLSPADFDYLCQRVLGKSLDAEPHYLPAMRVGNSTVACEAQVHRFKGRLILELENWPDRPALLETEIFTSLRAMLGQLQGEQTVEKFCQLAADHVRSFIGFDRVMVYRFDPDLSGHVIAEAKREDLEPYIGWHYPASDIPRQARELFRLSKLRLIPDMHYQPVPLMSAPRSENVAPVDMSFSVTRSVSPIHVEYLQNMGVDASMSISVVIGGQLWGLFACHHYSPRYVPHALRMACDFLAHTLSFLVAGREAAEDHAYRVRLNEEQRLFDEAVAGEGEFADAVRQRKSSTIVGIEADGAALLSFDGVTAVGVAPKAGAILALAEYFEKNIRDDVWSSDRLAEALPEVAALLPGVHGLMAACLSREPRAFAFWFRGEVPQTVNWAGDPTKPVLAGPLGDRLTPRKSFALWRQEVGGRSLVWEPAELSAAVRLRHSYHEFYARRAQKFARLNAELAERNSQLDAFAYIASHDLKEPLRGIHNFSQFVLEDCAGQLEPEAVANLQTVIRLTRRMESLLDALLKYSRLSRADIIRDDVDMNSAVVDALDLISALHRGRPAEIRVPRPLPPARADRELVSEVLANLLSNALKYNDTSDRWIEVGYLDPLPGLPVTYYVADNGIGIAAEHHAHIFKIFRRLHERDDYGGGAGAGLTITQKLIERHGGEVRVESAINKGSRFLFTFEPIPTP